MIFYDSSQHLDLLCKILLNIQFIPQAYTQQCCVTPPSSSFPHIHSLTHLLSISAQHTCCSLSRYRCWVWWTRWASGSWISIFSWYPGLHVTLSTKFFYHLPDAGVQHHWCLNIPSWMSLQALLSCVVLLENRTSAGLSSYQQVCFHCCSFVVL